MNSARTRGIRITFSLVILALSAGVVAQPSPLPSWESIEKKALGQRVYFYTWGGSRPVNDYLHWAADRLKKQHKIELKQVKVDDIATVVQRLIAEKKSMSQQASSVDLLWINGENFKRLKQHQLLFGPFVDNLPHARYINRALPIDNDFGEPVNGFEAPWGVAQLHFVFDKQRALPPPKNAAQLLAYAQSKHNRGRVTYPKIPDFHGSSFLKQLLLELIDTPEILYQPLKPESFQQVTAPLWNYLDKLHPYLWRKGQAFPRSATQLRQMFDDHELNLALSFNPLEVKHGIIHNKTPKTIHYSAMDIGALTNVHFLAIPKASAAIEAAMVTINFLLSPHAQRKKADPRTWGDVTVLDQHQLPAQTATMFPKQTMVFKAIAEPDTSWHEALEEEWLKRYAS